MDAWKSLNDWSVNVRDLRSQLASVLDRAAIEGERVGIKRHGKLIAALVPVADIDTLIEQDRNRIAAAELATAHEDDEFGENDETVPLADLLDIENDPPTEGVTEAELAASSSGIEEETRPTGAAAAVRPSRRRHGIPIKTAVTTTTAALGILPPRTLGAATIVPDELRDVIAQIEADAALNARLEIVRLLSVFRRSLLNLPAQKVASNSKLRQVESLLAQLSENEENSGAELQHKG